MIAPRYTVQNDFSDMVNYLSLILSFSRQYRFKTGQIDTIEKLRQFRSRVISTWFDDAGQGKADHFTRQRRIDQRLRAGSNAHSIAEQQR